MKKQGAASKEYGMAAKLFGSRGAYCALLRVAHAHDNALRKVAELVAEKIQAADMLALCADAYTQGDVVLLFKAQIGKTYAGESFAVKFAAFSVYTPGLEQAELAGAF
mgnify:CR=1 FL=1